MDIGRIIRRRRKAKDMTLEKLGALAGIDLGNLSRIERGLQNHTPEGLEALAAALETTVSEIVAEAEMADIKQANRIPNVALSDQEERDLLRSYWRLDGESRAALRQIVAAMARSLTTTPPNHAR